MSIEINNVNIFDKWHIFNIWMILFDAFNCKHIMTGQKRRRRIWKYNQGFSSNHEKLSSKERFFSRESNSRIANVCPSVCPSVFHKNTSASQNHAYQPNLSLSQPTCQLAIMPISHHATMDQPPSQPLRIITIGEHAYHVPSLSFDLNLRLLSLLACFFSQMK